MWALMKLFPMQPPATTRTWKDEVADLFVLLCAIAGGVVGLWFALEDLPYPRAGHTLAELFLDQVLGPLMAWFGGGLFAGASIGLVLCVALRLKRAPARTVER
jgi:hypothetical protein